MARPFVHRNRGSPASWFRTSQDGTRIDANFVYFQVFPPSVHLCNGVGDGAIERLLDQATPFELRMEKLKSCLLNIKSANQVRCIAGFSRRDPNIFCNRFSILHWLFPSCCRCRCCCWRCCWRWRRYLFGVALKCPGWRKLSKSMTYHVLRHVHGNKFSSVMNIKRLTYHIWNDHRTSGPSLNNFFRTLFVIFIDLNY